jgi:hypothetical protein
MASEAGRTEFSLGIDGRKPRAATRGRPL